jgi:hypothetical protein
MTQDEIIEMARRCGFSVAWPDVEKNFVAFAKLVALRYEKKIADLENIICQRYWNVLQEREECAKVCDKLASDWHEKHHPLECARQIRARGQA